MTIVFLEAVVFKKKGSGILGQFANRYAFFAFFLTKREFIKAIIWEIAATFL